MNEVAVQALTIDFSDVPAHIYLVAIHRDSILKSAHKFEQERGRRVYEYENSYAMSPGWRSISKVIRQSSKAHHRHTDRVFIVSTQLYRYIQAELFGLYDALSGVPNDYDTWIWSDSLTTIMRALNIWTATFDHSE
jgi:hypothetical protein